MRLDAQDATHEVPITQNDLHYTKPPGDTFTGPLPANASVDYVLVYDLPKPDGSRSADEETAYQRREYYLRQLVEQQGSPPRDTHGAGSAGS